MSTPDDGENHSQTDVSSVYQIEDQRSSRCHNDSDAITSCCHDDTVIMTSRHDDTDGNLIIDTDQALQQVQISQFFNII